LLKLDCELSNLVVLVYFVELMEVVWETWWLLLEIPRVVRIPRVVSWGWIFL